MSPRGVTKETYEKPQQSERKPIGSVLKCAKAAQGDS
jgi:hypothetical protein